MPTNIDLLRLAFERRFPIVAAHFQQPTPPMRAYLVIPIKTRLILLALHDGADEAAVKAALPYAKQTDVQQAHQQGSPHRARDTQARAPRPVVLHQPRRYPPPKPTTRAT